MVVPAALNELFFHFQPIFGPALKPIMYEALVRWRNPQGVILAPEHFLQPVLNGSEDSLTAFTALTIDAAAAALRDNGGMPRVSINLSPLQICRHETLAHLANLPDELRCRLVIEVTEQNLPEREVYSLWLGETAALGVDLVLDDLVLDGIESRLLPRLPVEGVKFDRQLLPQLLVSEPDVQLLEAIRGLRRLQLSLTAEGIEHPSQVEALSRLGINRFQGYGIGMPLPANGARSELRQQLPRPAQLLAYQP